MRILYLGSPHGTSGHRTAALRRLGHTVAAVDYHDFLPASAALKKIHWETGGVLSERRVTQGIRAEAEKAASAQGGGFDVVWVDSGRYVGPSAVRALKQRFGCPVISYNTDDPFGRRDRFSWSSYLRSVPCYDLVVVVREPNVAEAAARGARRVLRVFMCADEAAHAPRALPPGYPAHDVLFVGTYMPERGPFLAELLSLGVPASIVGNQWQRAPEWPVLQKAWKGPGVTCDDEYAHLIQSAKVCLGLLSKGNRDLHTLRTMEIPHLGSLLCAERTSEHCGLYVDGEEAVFWDDARECARQCALLLGDEARRRRIAARGRERCLRNGHRNETVLRDILEEIRQ